MTPKKYYLYVKTHNITGLKYLGKTIRDPFKYCGSGFIWSAHLKEHGKDISTEILLVTESKDELRKTGLFFSELWNVVISDEWANMIPENGSGGSFMPRSLETKLKLSKSLKGRVFTEEWKKNLRKNHKGNTGKTFSDDHRKKLSNSHKGKEITESQRIAVIKSNHKRKGKPLSDSHKEALSSNWWTAKRRARYDKNT